MKRVLIGIDDTDNKDSRGTGYRSRKLGKLIGKENLGALEGITRHQLFYDPRIPYTSQNSSACLEVFSNDIEKLTILCRDFLIEDSAIGSDAGLAVSEYSKVNSEIVNWGIRAKKEVLTQDEANILSNSANIYLEGLTGDKDGIIGALAAIGLKKSGNDGRFITLNGFDIRELDGFYETSWLIENVKISEIVDRSFSPVPLNEKVFVGNWVRPVFKDFKKIIIVDKALSHEEYEWEIVPKEFIKSLSN